MQGRVVAITGGGRGIGLATARALQAGGARVAIGDIDHEVAADAAKGVGDGVLAAPLDVVDRDSFARFLEQVGEELGPLDVLVNNAGIMPIGPMLDEDEAVARRIVDINLLGPLTGMKLALPGMLERGSGQIVNVASIAGRAPTVGGATYGATKAALVSLTETARVEYRGRGVAFTCVIPSFTATDLILGTKGTKFVATVEADDVGNAIAKAVKRPRPDVYVPGSIGPMLKLQGLIARRLRDAMNRALGADTAFLDVDLEARAAYDTRIRGGGGSGAP